MLSYCLVSINFPFQEVSMRVSYKSFKTCWCQLNQSQRDVNCCKSLHGRVLHWPTQVSSSISSCQAAGTRSGPWHTLGTGYGHVPAVWAHRPLWAPNTGIRTLKYSDAESGKLLQGKAQKIPLQQWKEMEEGFCVLKEQTISWGSPHARQRMLSNYFQEKHQHWAQVSPQGTMALQCPSCTCHHQPHLLLSPHSNPHRCLQIWTTNTWHRKSSETSENMLKMWQEADSTKWRFKCTDLEKWKGGMTVPEGKGKIAGIKF